MPFAITKRGDLGSCLIPRPEQKEGREGAKTTTRTIFLDKSQRVASTFLAENKTIGDFNFFFMNTIDY